MFWSSWWRLRDTGGGRQSRLPKLGRDGLQRELQPRTGRRWLTVRPRLRPGAAIGTVRKTVSQGNTMEQYTTAVPTPQHVTRVAGSDDGQSWLLPVEEPSRAEILAAIQGLRVALEGAGGSIVELQVEVGTLRKQMAQAGSTVGRLEARLEDAEGRSRRNNIRLLGFPERLEGSMVEALVENWIRDVLKPVGLSRVFLVEWVHRALVVPPWPGVPPRDIIAHLLNYRDRDCVLRAARDSDKAVFKNVKISIYPDYTNKVQNSQKSFLEVNAKLRTMNIRYMLLYPARLKAALSRPTGAHGVVTRVSVAEGSDWRNREREQMTDSMDQGAVDVSATRVEIQQDGTMAVAPDDLMAGTSAGLTLESSLTSMQS
ncbi:hypothetical protein NDU88_004036 [Pleurodeles waltl]|uniref:Uncharacterized protein n=1 Tax=Pleurodeles waltl TaxID=8319 RepID=A0AAV7LIL8_PLEWA|nr:hypothetical protein NDU88_004036 [Pleurodeles waltl]